ncbi:BglG family transcription antiterminator [Clostridium sp. CCUG 7971]|uniref:BglG family transcription antiterminator n=1 Tax=Clostridium sp. CCUG 7971 TaxID=2811414 RepID=UPI001ABA20A6|nr:BglG family transcription antiterminator [Clostridium sp. CCUG 7971]MBO3444529.1 transcription antiterminator [Clostridium sp. CCUG 7971]
MYINKRLEEILKILIKKDYATTQEISKKLNMSRRTTYYDIEKLEHYLRINSVELKNKRTLGYYLSSKDKEKISKLLKYASEDYILSPQERYLKIVIYILTYNDKLTIEKLCNLLQVSRNTVLNDLKDARSYISKYKLKIESYNGYEIKGDLKDRRYLFINLYNNYSYLFKECEFLEEYNALKETLESINPNVEKETYINYSLKYLTNMYKHYYRDFESLSFSEDEINFLESLSCKNLANDILVELRKVLNKDIADSEIYYIQTFIIRDSEIKEFFIKQSIKDKYMYEINMMVREFEKISCIYIDDYKEITNNIFNHLVPSLFRLRYGVYYPNHIKEEVKNKYKSIFQFTKQIVKNVEEVLGCFFNDDELAFISMYFGGYAVKMGVEIKIPKIVIVCNSGMATSQLLKSQIKDIFDLIEIKDILSLDEFNNYEKSYDFAITTVDISKDNGNVIKVNPVLNNLDKQNLISQISSTQSKFNLGQQIVRRIMNSVERYSTVTNKDKLREEIENIISSTEEKNEIYKVTLADLLNKNTISLNQEAKDWKDAIKVSSKSLIELGVIEKSYVKAMIRNIENLGPYIIILENVALPHSKPENGVNRLGISLTTFKDEICFSGNERHKARVFIVLAPKDKESHLNALVSINKMLSNKSNLEKILNASCESEVLEIVKQYS